MSNLFGRLHPVSAGGGGNGTLSGTVVDLSSSPVAGAIVQALSGGTEIGRGTSDASGNYSISLAAASYTAKQHPPYTHSIGPSESDSYSVTITAGQTTTQNFVVQPALLAVTWENATWTTTQIRAGSMWTGGGGGTSWSVYNTSQTGQQSYDATEDAMRWDFPVLGLPRSIDYTISNSARWVLNTGSITNWWFMCYSKETPQPWQASGNGSAGNGEHYKFFWPKLENNSNQSLSVHLAQFMEPAATGQLPGAMKFSWEWGDTTDGLFQTSAAANAWNPAIGSSGWGSNAAAGSGYSRHVHSMENLCSSSAVGTIWMDGLVQATHTSAVLSGQTLGGSWEAVLQLGVNMNTSPDQAQQRYFKNCGVYQTRPGLI